MLLRKFVGCFMLIQKATENLAVKPLQSAKCSPLPKIASFSFYAECSWLGIVR